MFGKQALSLALSPRPATLTFNHGKRNTALLIGLSWSIKISRSVTNQRFCWRQREKSIDGKSNPSSTLAERTKIFFSGANTIPTICTLTRKSWHVKRGKMEQKKQSKPYVTVHLICIIYRRASSIIHSITSLEDYARCSRERCRFDSIR